MKKLLLVLMLAGIAFAGISVTGYTVSKDTFQPGEPGVLTATVVNPTGSERVSSITMSLDMPYELTLTSSPSLSDIETGGSTIVSVPFKIKQNASTGIYLAKLIFKGYVAASDGSSKYVENRVSLPVTVVNEPSLSVTSDRQLLTGLDTVKFTITNNGGVAKNAYMTVDGGIAIYGADRAYLGTVSGTKDVELTLDSREAQDGAVNMQVVLEYEDDLGYDKATNSTVRMTVRKEKLDLSILQQNPLATRSEGTLTLTARNDGNETLKDVRLSLLNTTGLKLKDDTEFKFGDLAPGQSAADSVTVFTELPPGLNKLETEVGWIEEDVQMEESRLLALDVDSDTEVGVYLEAKPLPLTIGADHTISVLVSNLGSYAIENVDVGLSSPALRSLDISDRQYIGGLQTDDFSTVQFMMRVNATEEGTHPVAIRVTYRDTSGEWKTETVSQSITVYNHTVSEQSPLPLIGGVFVLAVAVWYFRFRKKPEK